MTYKTSYLVYLFLFLVIQLNGQVKLTKSFSSGKTWVDNQGKPIQAHGGGVLYYDGVYYWYGENKDTATINQNTGFKGISCYSSKDLYNWKNEGIVLKPVFNDSNHDLYPSKVVERPKVIYNDKNKQFVMWMHIDQQGYKFARQGVATSKNPIGPFEYVNSIRPNGSESRDMTIFKDDDGKAYAIYSSENNKTLHVSLLNDDFLEHSGTYKRIMVDMSREAPAIFKSRKKYFLITSYCTGWSPNPAQYAMADSIMGNWKEIENPCKGEGAETTFGAQSTFVLPVQGRNESFIFMADKWNPKNLSDSKYVWLPIQFNGNKLHIKWINEWNLDFFKRFTW